MADQEAAQTAETDVLTADEARRRAADLLEQAFAVQSVPVGDPWASAPEIRSVLPEGERLLYVIAAQAYSTLAVTLPPAPTTGEEPR